MILVDVAGFDPSSCSFSPIMHCRMSLAPQNSFSDVSRFLFLLPLFLQQVSSR